MPLGDLFKSQAQKDKEAREAKERLAKETREQSELNLFKKKRQLESKIKQLEREKLQLGKQASELKDSASLSAYKAKSKELANHKLALVQIGTVETQLRGSTTGVDALGDLVAEALREIDILTTPEETGGMTEDEKIKIELSLTKKLSELPSASGGIDLEGLAGKVWNDEEEMSDEMALLEIQELLAVDQKKSPANTDAKIKAQLKDLDSKISSLES
ncbi:MAG: hypothetical protein FWB78_01890 [Treponema sp.]|nr:hypothetical protein [Treponema sp.]